MQGVKERFGLIFFLATRLRQKRYSVETRCSDSLIVFHVDAPQQCLWANLSPSFDRNWLKLETLRMHVLCWATTEMVISVDYRFLFLVIYFLSVRNEASGVCKQFIWGLTDDSLPIPEDLTKGAVGRRLSGFRVLSFRSEHYTVPSLWHRPVSLAFIYPSWRRLCLSRSRLKKDLIGCGPAIHERFKPAI